MSDSICFCNFYNEFRVFVIFITTVYITYFSFLSTSEVLSMTKAYSNGNYVLALVLFKGKHESHAVEYCLKKLL